MSDMKKTKGKVLVFLHIILFVYSFTGVLSKFAAKEESMSGRFILLYGGMLIILFLYALLWQRSLKYLSLTTAYANKSIVVIWGMIWGAILFKDVISIGDIIGAIIVFLGISMVVKDDQ